MTCNRPRLCWNTADNKREFIGCHEMSDLAVFRAGVGSPESTETENSKQIDAETNDSREERHVK